MKLFKNLGTTLANDSHQKFYTNLKYEQFPGKNEIETTDSRKYPILSSAPKVG